MLLALGSRAGLTDDLHAKLANRNRVRLAAVSRLAGLRLVRGRPGRTSCSAAFDRRRDGQISGTARGFIRPIWCDASAVAFFSADCPALARLPVRSAFRRHRFPRSRNTPVQTGRSLKDGSGLPRHVARDVQSSRAAASPRSWPGISSWSLTFGLAGRGSQKSSSSPTESS